MWGTPCDMLWADKADQDLATDSQPLCVLCMLLEARLAEFWACCIMVCWSYVTSCCLGRAAVHRQLLRYCLGTAIQLQATLVMVQAAVRRGPQACRVYSATAPHQVTILPQSPATRVLNCQHLPLQTHPTPRCSFALLQLVKYRMPS